MTCSDWIALVSAIATGGAVLVAIFQPKILAGKAKNASRNRVIEVATLYIKILSDNAANFSNVGAAPSIFMDINRDSVQMLEKMLIEGIDLLDPAKYRALYALICYIKERPIFHSGDEIQKLKAQIMICQAIFPERELK